MKTNAADGHTDKTLIQKLGYLPEQTVYAPTAPEWFTTYLRGEGAHMAHHLPADWAHVFITRQESLEHWLQRQPLEHLRYGLWISWPKQASGKSTDVTEQTLRDMILPLGWVDTKVSAVDNTWSGLKFVRRKGAVQ